MKEAFWLSHQGGINQAQARYVTCWEYISELAVEGGKANGLYVSYNKVPQPFQLCRPVGGIGGRFHVSGGQAPLGGHANGEHVHALCRCSRKWGCIHAHPSATSAAQFQTAQGPVVGCYLGLGDPYSTKQQLTSSITSRLHCFGQQHSPSQQL